MNKLFVFQDNDDLYKLELKTAYDISTVGEKQWIDIRRLDVDYLIRNQINVVISTAISKEWSFTLKGLKIVSIVLGNSERNYQLWVCTSLKHPLHIVVSVLVQGVQV